MTARYRGGLASVAAYALVIVLLPASWAWAGDLRLPFSCYRLPTVSDALEAGEDSGEAAPSRAGDAGAGGTAPEENDSRRGDKIVGSVMLGSGVLLCSWGIVDWQTEETQCCPARNTDNVAKIVVGVVLINAGLVYLIAGGL